LLCKAEALPDIGEPDIKLLEDTDVGGPLNHAPPDEPRCGDNEPENSILPLYFKCLHGLNFPTPRDFIFSTQFYTGKMMYMMTRMDGTAIKNNRSLSKFAVILR
jgi:hypothetical protein